MSPAAAAAQLRYVLLQRARQGVTARSAMHWDRDIRSAAGQVDALDPTGAIDAAVLHLGRGGRLVRVDRNDSELYELATRHQPLGPLQAVVLASIGRRPATSTEIADELHQRRPSVWRACLRLVALHLAHVVTMRPNGRGRPSRVFAAGSAIA